MRHMNMRRYKIKFLIVTAVVVVCIFSTLDTRNISEISTSREPYQLQQNSLEYRDTEKAKLFKRALESLTPILTKANHQLNPRKLLVREKVGLRWDLFPERYWEMDILPRISGNITVLDVGANTGQFAIPMAELGHTVISLEPNRHTCETLKNKLEIRGLTTQVIVHCIAASDKEGVTRFQETSQSTGFTASTTTNKEGTIEIATKRVDDLVDISQELFLFKTDTQGFEMDVLHGAQHILSGDQVFLLLVEFSYGLLNRAGTDPIALLNLIYDFGFVCTYMAVHTRMEQKDQSPPRYSMVEYYPDRGFSGDWISFETFTESLRVVDAPGAAGVSGWSDLLCFKP